MIRSSQQHDGEEEEENKAQLGKRPLIHDEEDDRDRQRLKYELPESHQGAGGSSQPQLGQHEAQSRPDFERALQLIQRRKALTERAQRVAVLHRECEMRLRRSNAQLGQHRQQHESQSRPEVERARQLLQRQKALAESVRRVAALHREREMRPNAQLGQQRQQHEAQSRPDAERARLLDRDVDGYIHRRLASMIRRHKAQWVELRRQHGSEPEQFIGYQSERSQLMTRQSAEWDELRRERETARTQLRRNEAQRAQQWDVLFGPITDEDADDYYNWVLTAMYQRLNVEWAEQIRRNEAQRAWTHVSNEAQQRLLSARHFAERSKLDREHETWLGRLNDPDIYACELEAQAAREARFRSRLRDRNSHVMMTSNLNLSEDLISRYLKIRVCENGLVDKDKEQMCTICQDDLCENRMDIVTLDCQHEYHFSCIKQWLQRKNVCPLCNRIVIS